jgi:two-component system, NtrC family, response regulator PilR
MENKRILIVDDETAILVAFRKLLQKPGVSVDTAETMGEAEALLKENDYAVAVVDLRLTGVIGEEGLEVIRYINEIRPRTRVILVTGYGSPAVMHKAQELGAAFYFEKPVSGETLRTALRSLGAD